MNITAEMIYWITRLDYIQGMFVALSIFTGVVTLFLVFWTIASFAAASEDKEEYKVAWRSLRYTGISTCVVWVFICCAVFTPSTNDMCMIYVVPKIVNSDFVQEDLPKDAREIYDLAKQAIVKQLTGEEKK